MVRRVIWIGESMKLGEFLNMAFNKRDQVEVMLFLGNEGVPRRIKRVDLRYNENGLLTEIFIIPESLECARKFHKALSQ